SSAPFPDIFGRVAQAVAPLLVPRLAVPPRLVPRRGSVGEETGGRLGGTMSSLPTMKKLLGLTCLTLAFFGCGTSGGGGFAPSAPTGVTAAPGNAQVTISWSAVTGASYYNIYWSTTNGVTPGSGSRISGATNPFTQSGLTNDTTYYYVVTAVGSGGESAPSSQVSATPSASGANAPYIWATLYTLDPGTSESPYW